MAIAELDELFKSFSTPEDRATFEQLLERNTSVRDRVTSGEDLTRSLLDNDTDAAARVEARRIAATQRTQPSSAAHPTTPASPSAADRAGIDLKQVDDLVAAKVRAIFDTEFAGDTFNNRVKSIVETTANGMVPSLITTTTKNADEIFTIRSAHQQEFGKPLDTTAFTTFIDAAKARGTTYGSYVDAFNEFVKEDRVTARITKGIAEGVAAKTQPAVPGTTLSTGTSVASQFMRSNKMTALDSERGKAVDAGARALAQMRVRHAE